MIAPFPTDQVFIGGQWRAPVGGQTLPIENPSTGEPMGALAAAGAEDIDAAVQAARAALNGPWGRMTAAERGRVLARMGREVEARFKALVDDWRNDPAVRAGPCRRARVWAASRVPAVLDGEPVWLASNAAVDWRPQVARLLAPRREAG